MFFNFLNQVIDKTFNQKLSSKIIVIDFIIEKNQFSINKKSTRKNEWILNFKL
jgi:hypothetical protein